jgi:hypothetical protein
LVKAQITTDKIDHKALMAKIVNHCQQHLPYYMVPTLLEVVETIATSAMGFVSLLNI